MRFNQAEYAEYYHKQMVEGGYPGKLLPFVIKELQDSRDVLDIGSGTGFFSVALARAGHNVTAVEPSAEMISIMKKNTPVDYISSIKIYQTSWENWKGIKHDASICVHSLYPMPDVKKAIALINESASKKIIIVRDSLKMRTLAGAVREKFGINPNRDLNTEIVSALDEFSVRWNVVRIFEERRHFIRDVQLETDSILYQLKLDAGFKDEISDIIRTEMISSSGIDFFNAIYSDNAYIFN